MRYGFLGLLALAGIAVATPASAQWGHHHHGWGHRGPGVGLYFGTPGPAYGYGRCVRERVVRYRPNGTRVVRWIRRCY